MGLLTSLGFKPHASVTRGRAHQTAGRLLARLERAAWQDAEQMLAGLSDENREDLLQACADLPATPDLAARWVQASPQCALARLLLGAALIGSGWRIRGTEYSHEVDAAAWEPFLNELKNAEAPLHAAAQLDKTSADAYAWLMLAGIGGDGTKALLQTLFRAAIARAPLHWPAHYRYFMGSTEKWGGSHKDMFSFARAAAGRAPRGHPIHCLIATAYCEYALAEGARAGALLRTPQGAREVAGALYAWLDADADTLRDRLLDAGGSFAGFALNHFAVACHLSGAVAEGREVVDALRGEIEVLPWIWIAEGGRERGDLGFVHDRVKRALDRA